jgi:hypothetical protein
MNCAILDRLECDFIDASRKSQESWSDEELVSLAAVKDHLREGHEGKPCPDPENLIKR